MTAFGLGVMGLILTLVMATLAASTYESHQIRKRNRRKHDV